MPSSRRMRGDPPSVLGAWVGNHMMSVFHLADHGMGIEADVRKQLDLTEPLRLLPNSRCSLIACMSCQYSCWVASFPGPIFRMGPENEASYWEHRYLEDMSDLGTK